MPRQGAGGEGPSGPASPPGGGGRSGAGGGGGSGAGGSGAGGGGGSGAGGGGHPRSPEDAGREPIEEGLAGYPGGVGDLDEEAVRAELAAMQEQITAAPAEDVIANHAYGLFELAALHLSRRPTKLDEARLAIDALGGVVDALGERLGKHTAGLRDGLAQIRLAYVQIASSAAEAEAEADGGSSAEETPAAEDAGGEAPDVEP